MRYFNDFEDKKDVFDAFHVDAEDQKDIEILVASYSYEAYEGDAFVLFIKDSQFYEVNGSHCSCNGLEDQWDPEETTLDALKFRLEEGYGITHRHGDEVAKAIHLAIMFDVFEKEILKD